MSSISSPVRIWKIYTSLESWMYFMSGLFSTKTLLSYNKYIYLDILRYSDVTLYSDVMNELILPHLTCCSIIYCVKF